MWIMSQDERKYINFIPESQCKIEIVSINQDGDLSIEIRFKDCAYSSELGRYSSLLKARIVLRQLADAIQRDQKEFTMPYKEDV